MCWTDLITRDSKGCYNRTAAKLYGLAQAVYLEELLDVLVQVQKKQTYDPASGFFYLDRQYIESRTTVSTKDQVKYDKLFQSLCFLEADPNNADRIRFDMSRFVQALVDERLPTKQSGKEIKAVKKTRDPEGKKNGMISNMSRHMESLVEDEDLRSAYREWISACVNNKTLNNIAVDHFIEDLGKFTNDKSIQIAEIRRHAEKAYNKFYAPTSVSGAAQQTRIRSTEKPAEIADVNMTIKF